MAVTASVGSVSRPGTRTSIRPWLVSVALFQVIFGAVAGSAIASHAWLSDATRAVLAAQAIQAGTFGVDHGYLYSPLAALLVVPITWVPAGLAGGAWLVARAAVLLAAIRHETRAMAPIDRVLVGLAVAAFLPTVYDLMLGNVSVLLAASIGLVAWSRDRFRAGLPLGLALATAPKPALLPILVWMALFRRKALAGSLGTAGLATLATLAVVGLGPYLAWIDVLRHPEYLAGPQGGNLSLSALMPPLLAVPLAIAAIAAGLVALRRGETPGFLAVLAIGLLVAPYTLAYGAVFLLLAVRPLAAVLPAPVLTLLAIVAPILVIVFLPLLAGTVLAIALVVAPSRWPPLRQENPT
jgi:hypothetical protein